MAKRIAPTQDLADKDFSNYLVLPVEKLRKAPWNYKKEDEFIQGQLTGGIKRNGQIENIIVREMKDGMYEVVNGNHRLDSVQSAGRKKIIAYNKGKISDAEAIRIATSTNETRFPSDQIKLADLMKTLMDTFTPEDLTKDMPWTEEQIVNFAQLTEFNWENPKMPDPKEEPDADGWITFKLRLPEAIAQQLQDQIDRFKHALNPADADLASISAVPAVECMLQHIAQLPDSELV